MTRDEARIKFLDLMIPQLEDGGFTRLVAEYAVERDRLVAARNLAGGPRLFQPGHRLGSAWR